MPELRTAAGPLVNNRRAIAGLSILSATVLGGIALFQVGILKHLPDPPWPAFDADAVHGSPEAYRLLGTPDALLGMASYSVTACLAAMGSADRGRACWIPLAMGAKTAADAAMAIRLGLKQATQFRKYSIWSLLVTASTLGALALAIPEVIHARRATLVPPTLPTL